MPHVRLVPASGGEAREFESGYAVSLLVSAMKVGAPLRHDCGGRAVCGTCRVAVSEPGRTSPMGGAERERLAALGEALDGRVRLACQTVVSGDVAIRGLVGPAAPVGSD